jgi:PBP1b-binding outer membrane lipoprotein LpoB
VFALTITILLLGGCANIPAESVKLNNLVSQGITSIHQSNINFVNQYFTSKKNGIDKFEHQALDNFFSILANASAKPEAPKLEKADFEKIKQQIDRIHSQGNSFRNELEQSRLLIIESLQSEYNALLSANNSVSSILQSAVDVDQARSEGISKVNSLSNGRINFTDVDAKVSEYLSTIGNTSDNAVGLYISVQNLFNQSAGDQ